MRKRIAESAYYVLRSDIYKNMTDGEYQQIGAMDIASIIRELNRGNTDVLNRKDVITFINSYITAQEIVNYIITCKILLSYKDYFLSMIEKEQSEYRYNPDAIFIERRYSSTIYSGYTYKTILYAMEMAEQVLNNKNTYLLLKNLLKYESIRPELKKRKEVFESLKQEDKKREELSKLIQTDDKEIGIIQIIESEKSPRIVAGTKKDIAISELIGVPFPADAEREGYDYGPHGDYYMPPYSCKKTFHAEPETKTHQQMIKIEQQRRESLSYITSDEKGYIYQKGVALLISKRELTRNGIDPERVGWKPLKITPKTKSVLTLRDESGYNLPLKEKIVIKAKTL